MLEVDLPGRHGFDIPAGAKAARRAPCSACGLSKRHLFDEAAINGGYDVLVTGHNLDDEAAVLFGNTMHWNTDYLGRQLPVLPARDGFPRKAKPLVRLAERESAAYCVLRGIDYIVDECPMAAGNRHLGYKEALNSSRRAHQARSTTSTSGSWRGRPNDFATRSVERTGRPCGLASAAAHRRRAACARSAGWSSGRPVPSRCSSAVGHGHDRRAVAASAGRGEQTVPCRRADPADRPQEAALPGHADRGRRVPHPFRLRAP